MRVFVYYNLRRKVWSVRALQGPNKGKVVAHSATVLLHNAVGKVCRQRNVHAGIVGTLVHLEREGLFYGHTVTYNPCRYTSFVYEDTELPFNTQAEYAYLHGQQVEVTP